MPMPDNIAAIDLMLSIPSTERTGWYDFLDPLIMDEESRQTFKMPAQYMFRDIPEVEAQEDYIAYTLEQMDRFNIEKAMLGVDETESIQNLAVKRHPERFFASYECNPNRGMEEVRKIRRLHEEYDLRAVTGFPAGLCPQVPVNDKKWYPIYTTCIDLDLVFCPCVGVPGPRVPMEPQKVQYLDEVCWFFPELKIVMRHGAEPWTDLAWRLMLKYPNLYYSTSAYSPKYYPENIIEFANTRGADKIMYAGYFPMGISLEKIFSELPGVPLRDEVWPKFLRENAQRVFRL